METSSYRDHLQDGESVAEDVEQLLQSLERQGWWVHLRRRNRLRYWCECPKQHNAWVDLDPESDTYGPDTANMLSMRSCFSHTI
jgi:hypothetical protein